MPERYDDRLPEHQPLPRPSGWFEVFCCGSMLLVILAVVVVIALVH